MLVGSLSNFFNLLKLLNLPIHFSPHFVYLPPPPWEKQQNGKASPFLNEAFLLSSGRLFGDWCRDSLGSPRDLEPQGCWGGHWGSGWLAQSSRGPEGLAPPRSRFLQTAGEWGETGGHVQYIYVRHPDRGHGYLYNPAWVFM